MRGEQVIVIDGLALPEGRRGAAVERASAAMLFLERARQVSSNFTITTKNYEAISRICRLVAGVPLAIELAASWVHVLSCEEIAAEIARGVDFLSVSNRDLPPRHRSLRAVIDHSWQLLTDEERDLLAHLSIFQGGARREAISVVRGDAQGGSRLLLLLAALVDKSLVRQSIGADGVTRYDLHEFVRQYAAERLAEDPATWTRAVSAHAAYYADWLAEQETRLKSERQKATVLSIISEIAHVRAAWNWACDRQDAQMLRQMLPTLDWFYELRGWYVEATAAFGRGAQALKPLIETTDDEGIHTCYWLMFGREGFHTLRRDPVFAVQRLRDSVAMLRQVSQHGEQIHCIKGLAYITMFAGDYTRAQALLEEARSIATAREDHWNLAMTLVIRGALEALRSEAVTARQHLDDALAVARTVGDPRPVSTALTYLGLTSLAVGEIDQAERGCREAHILAADHQDRFQMSLSLQALGRVALAKGEYSEADWLFNESLATAREIGDRWMEAQALGCLSALAGATGDGTRARELRRSAVSIADRAPTAIALAELAALAVLELDVHPDAALIALAFVQEHPLTQPATRATAASNWARAAEMVGEAQLIAAQTAAQLRVNERPSALLALFPPL
jgi:tetratricopeptide (TPR) repeat protein